jgi:hypothetical protein
MVLPTMEWPIVCRGCFVDLVSLSLLDDRVASDGDRRLRQLLSPAWHAVRLPGLWSFHLPAMAQERLFAAAREPSGCLVLSHLHRLLKVMRYRILVEGLFVPISAPDWPMAFPSEVWTAMHFPKA